MLQVVWPDLPRGKALSSIGTTKGGTHSRWNLVGTILAIDQEVDPMIHRPCIDHGLQVSAPPPAIRAASMAMR